MLNQTLGLWAMNLVFVLVLRRSKEASHVLLCRSICRNNFDTTFNSKFSRFYQRTHKSMRKIIQNCRRSLRIDCRYFEPTAKSLNKIDGCKQGEGKNVF